MIPPENREEWIVRQALERLGAERAVFLDGACAGDLAMRARLDALLAAHEQPDTRLAGADASTVKANERSQDEAIGQTLGPRGGLGAGRYKLLEKIGEGGCGVVYVAEQSEPVRRRVALKVIKLGMDTRQVVARFEAERQALAMMDHPNIAKVLDAGTTDVGRPYFVMELVRGIKITDYCDQEKISTKDRIYLLIKVCQAIQHAHQKGIIHRDIKPSNILVTLHDGAPVPKVIDFGIAKATEGRLTDATVYTQLHQFIGTPAYMSPEQAEMSGLDIDTRTDIYSLGVLLYELLTGSTPFDAKELMSQGIDAIRKTIREKEPARPSTRLATLGAAELTTRAKRCSADRSKLLHQLKGDIDWIVMKCLEKDRTRRYETADGLAMDLHRHLNNEPVVARPPSAVYKLQKAWRRNKVVYTAAAAVAAALVIGIGISMLQTSRARRAEREQSHLHEVAVKALDGEKLQRKEAESARANEGRLRREVEARAYASDMNLAQEALKINNLGKARRSLDRYRPQPGEEDLRGWEWRYLWQQSRSDALFTLCQKTDQISGLAVSHDGKWVAVGERVNGGVSVWDVRTRKEIFKCQGGPSSGRRLAFSPRQAVLAFAFVNVSTSGETRKTVRLWDGRSQKIVIELPLAAECYGLQFSEDGQILVVSSGEPDNQISLWRIPEGREVRTFAVAQIDWDIGTPLAVALDLKVAAHSLPRSGFRVLDLSTGLERWKAQTNGDRVFALAFSPDGKLLASSDGLVVPSIHLWEVASGREIARLDGHKAWVGQMVFGPDGKTLASASADQTIRLWDITSVTNARASHVLLGHRMEVNRLALLPNNTTLVSGCKDGSVGLWDTTSNQREHARATLPTAVRAWRFSPDSTSVLVVNQEGQVGRWHGKEFGETEVLLNIGTGPLHPCISENGSWLAAGSTNGLIHIWDLRERTPLNSELRLDAAMVLPWTFLNNGKTLAIIRADDGSVEEWDLSSRNRIKSITAAFDAGNDFTYSNPGNFSHDERWCITQRGQQPLVMSDLMTGRDLIVGFEGRDAVSAAFSNDSKIFAVASDYGFVRLWETKSLKEITTLSGFLLGAHSVTFSPDGKRIAAGSSGQETIKLWEAQTWQEVLTLEGEGSVFNSSAFSPDGNVLGASNERGVLHLWRAPSWEDIDAAESSGKGNL